VNAAAVSADQPALPGVKAPPQTSARPVRPAALERQLGHGEPLKVALIGRLAEPPRLIDDPAREGRALLQLVLRQHVDRHPQAWPVVAVWHYPEHQGQAEAHRRAQALVQALPEGAEVVVLGRGVEASHHAGEPCLRVLKVLGVKAEHLARPPATEGAAPAPLFDTSSTSEGPPC
jgi:hypothetical protein